ncbi:hypothetical protein M9H77_25626 [Catharanthus roseus]|uniref:Uncharacterized protein n=1 Tax=Catharanthus roseus TaxID=4058 RepID=A0ACC0A7E7_CATRO|nr:hypothetical protein M9H77_25626 [Catharanthus roseus]
MAILQITTDIHLEKNPFSLLDEEPSPRGDVYETSSQLDLCVSKLSPTHLFYNNQAALHILSNSVFHEWTKNIEIECHFVRDELQAHRILPAYIPIKTQPADIFTKVLRQS